MIAAHAVPLDRSYGPYEAEEGAIGRFPQLVRLENARGRKLRHFSRRLQRPHD